MKNNCAASACFLFAVVWNILRAPYILEINSFAIRIVNNYLYFLQNAPGWCTSNKSLLHILYVCYSKL